MGVRMMEQEDLFDKGWASLTKYIYEYSLPDNSMQIHHREVYNRGNGVVALLYNPIDRTVLLTRQFRLPTYLNGNPGGLMIEAPAGKLEKDEDPVEGMLRELKEETGYKIEKLEKVYEAYMSPGSVTEMLHFYIGKYSEKDKVFPGGGLASEQENIEVIHLPLEEALSLVMKGQIKDAKTIILLQHLKIDILKFPIDLKID